MYHGVENLLELVGVVTRASDKKYLPRFFRVIISKDNTTMATQNLHIGQLIKAVFDESGMTVSEFARQIHLERSSVYNIFERPSIDAMLLARISLVLKHNFLHDVEQHCGLVQQVPSFTLRFDNLSPEIARLLSDLLNEASIL